MILSKIKVYGYILLGLLVGGLTIAVKILAGKNSRLTKELETKDAKIHHAKVVEQKKQQTEVELRSRTADLAKELEEKKTSSELSDPNKDW